MMTNSLRLCVYILLALMAFAGNSVLCRLALSDGLIDPASFTIWRLLSGAITLLLLCGFQCLKQKKTSWKTAWSEGSWLSAFSLFIYATSFSYAYVTLSTGIGALILFGAVQLTLISFSVWAGQSLSRLELLGLMTAFSSFVYLVLPTLSSPSFIGFVLMTLSGIAWGLYTWRGKRTVKPLFATASNFIRAIPMLLIIMLFINLEELKIMNSEGVVLAVISGSLMSGLGYAVWYAVLPFLRASLAGVLQLLVPIIATIGGVVFANEPITLHLVIASIGVLGGVLIVINARQVNK